MSSLIEIGGAEELVAPTLQALRPHALENRSTLSPLRLQEVARLLAEGLVRFAATADKPAAEALGTKVIMMGLAISGLLGAMHGFTEVLCAQGATREETAARALLVSDFASALILGMRVGEYQLFDAQRSTLERVLHETTEQERENLRLVIRELSTPVVPLADRVLLLPLVGAVDIERSSLILERLLAAIVAHRAQVVLMDVTGVPSIEVEVAVRLFTVARSARLLGAQVIVVGLSPAFAQSLVSLGVDAGEVLTLGSVQRGLEYVARRRAGRPATPQLRGAK